ncbi:MAG: hypothetical protein ACOYPR_20000, partial [Saprospiraceae bacterium]
KCPRFGKTFWESVEDFFQAVIDGSGSFSKTGGNQLMKTQDLHPKTPIHSSFMNFQTPPIGHGFP